MFWVKVFCARVYPMLDVLQKISVQLVQLFMKTQWNGIDLPFIGTRLLKIQLLLLPS